MKSINFDVVVKDLDDKPLKDDSGNDLNLKVVVSNVLCGVNGDNDAARLIDLALQIRKSEGAIEIHEGDLKKIRDIAVSGKLVSLVTAHILRLID